MTGHFTYSFMFEQQIKISTNIYLLNLLIIYSTFNFFFAIHLKNILQIIFVPFRYNNETISDYNLLILVDFFYIQTYT